MRDSKTDKLWNNIRGFFYTEHPKMYLAHYVPFLRNLPEDVLQQSEDINQERRRYRILNAEL